MLKKLLIVGAAVVALRSLVAVAGAAAIDREDAGRRGSAPLRRRPRSRASTAAFTSGATTKQVSSSAERWGWLRSRPVAPGRRGGGLRLRRSAFHAIPGSRPRLAHRRL
jgi:hypothetical protein